MEQKKTKMNEKQRGCRSLAGLLPIFLHSVMIQQIVSCHRVAGHSQGCHDTTKHAYDKASGGPQYSRQRARVAWLTEGRDIKNLYHG